MTTREVLRKKKRLSFISGEHQATVAVVRETAAKGELLFIIFFFSPEGYHLSVLLFRSFFLI